MVATDLRIVVDAVLRRAQRQAYIVPRDIRDELAKAGQPDEQWKDVLNAARPSLHYRQGRYYSIQTISPRLHEQQSQQQVVFHTARELIRRHQAAKAENERRQQDRIDFFYPVKVQTEDGRDFHVMTRDLSPTGIRLLANRSFLGQKISVHLAPTNGGRDCTFLVRILWSCAVGDDLYENGGAFLGMVGSA
ncbi:MAG TPA: PilZ domain-containing protein [Gemmataceae bacterium]|nr:PilZ domain-containing protein [Gemmataceae bacterium]